MGYEFGENGGARNGVSLWFRNKIFSFIPTTNT